MTADSVPDIETLLSHADWLGRLSRQLCRDHHAAADATQETLLAAMQSPPRYLGNLRGFLARVLRNHLRLQARTADRAARRERAAAHDSIAGATADLVARAEMQQLLGRLVLELPTPQRELVLWHYFDGDDTATVARRAGRSEHAVRSHLRRARDTLRQRLQQNDGQAGRTFGVLLTTTAPATAAVAFSTLALTMKTKIVAALLIAALGLVLFESWPTGERIAPQPPQTERQAAASGEVPSTNAARTVADSASEAGMRIAAADSTGDLQVHVLWPDGTPGAGLHLTMTMLSGAMRGTERLATTDADGKASFAHLAPGDGGVRVDTRRGANFTIVGGQSIVAEVAIHAGVDVHGIVVDAAGQPVPTARIWLSRFNNGDEGEQVATAAIDGTFVIRAVPHQCFVAAVAPGKLQSTLTMIQGSPGTTQDVRIELDEPGASLLGHVFLADGKPAVGARVLVGNRSQLAWHRESVWRHHRPTAETRCDADGGFVVDGLPIDTDIDVWVRGADTAALRQQVRLPFAGPHAMTFRLAVGAQLHGIARDGEGRPASGVLLFARSLAVGALRSDGVTVGPAWCFDTTTTNADGAYTLPHLAAGTARVEARQTDPRRAAVTTLVLQDGEERRWDPQLGTGASIRGVVVDETGRALAGWEVQSSAPGPDAHRQAFTDTQGHFELSDCGDLPRRVQVLAPGGHSKIPSLVRLGVSAGGSELRLVVPEKAVPSAFVIGRIAGPAGKPPRQQIIYLRREAMLFPIAEPATADGSFRIGPLPPGTYRASASREVGHHTVWTAPFELGNDATVDLGTITFAPLGFAAVTVRDATGTPLDDVDCQVVREIGGFDEILAASTTHDGRVQFALTINDEPLVVRVFGADHPVVNAPLTLVDGSQVAVELTVPRSVPCVLRFAAPTEAGLQGMSCRWKLDGVTLLQQTEWVRGTEDRLVPRRLVAGDYELTVTDELGRSVRNTFSIAEDDTPGREILIRLP